MSRYDNENWVTGAELARRLNISRQRVNWLYQQAILPRRPYDKKYNLIECIEIIERRRLEYQDRLDWYQVLREDSGVFGGHKKG